MKDGTEFMVPRARDTSLIVRKLDDEVLVFDVDQNRAHVFNQVAAHVWNLCDGETTVSEMEQQLQREFDPSVNSDTIWQALAQFSQEGLLAEDASRMSLAGRMSRLQMMKTMGL